MHEEEIKKLFHRQEHYVLGTYSPTDLVLTRGALTRVWDIHDNQYLDFTSGISVCNLGHCHPRVTEAIQRQAATLVHVSNLFMNNNQPELAARIAQNSFDGKVFFCNSGAEANEGLIKFARRWGNENGRHQIITMENSFHGRTLATLAATGRAKYRKGFQPDTPGFLHVPFNSIDAARAAVNDTTAAILLEPVQGEGGVIPAHSDYLTALRQLCDENGILLLFDEVQCGMGRTGTLFAYQKYGVIPDGMAMAKALANGFPIGAFEVKSEYADILPPGTHASTFGGNPLACAAGVAVFDTFEKEDILDNCNRMAAYLWDELSNLAQRHDTVLDIRGMGLMIGIELASPVKPLVQRARENGLLVLSAGENVLRLLPPLVIEANDVDRAVSIIDKCLDA
ncbi:MAG: aspartate aminotransferase family protein [Candidatus Pacebacteria bacterium]|nr:aspartate aminotransferase family protein [Candidatus Paceibacterota bacterium]